MVIGPTPTGYRGDGAGMHRGGLEINIADQTGLAILGLDTIDTHIDHCRSRLDPVTFYHPGTSYRTNHDIGRPADVGQIFGAGVGDGDGAMFPQ